MKTDQTFYRRKRDENGEAVIFGVEQENINKFSDIILERVYRQRGDPWFRTTDTATAKPDIWKARVPLAF